MEEPKPPFTPEMLKKYAMHLALEDARRRSKFIYESFVKGQPDSPNRGLIDAKGTHRPNRR